jgi:hypothetical protein
MSLEYSAAVVEAPSYEADSVVHQELFLSHQSET